MRRAAVRALRALVSKTYKYSAAMDGGGRTQARDLMNLERMPSKVRQRGRSTCEELVPTLSFLDGALDRRLLLVVRRQGALSPAT